MTVLMVLGAAVCGDTADVFGATFSTKSPFKIYNSETKKTETRTYKHNSNFKDNIILNGVDVSAYQNGSKSNYNTAKKNGVDYAIIRATFTYTGSGKKEEDAQWAAHFDKARAAGLMTGLYCFSQATSKKEARAEANFICDVYEKHIKKAYGNTNYNAYLDMPIYMDYESGCTYDANGKASPYRINSLTPTARTTYAEIFCETVASRGYTPGIYASTSFLNHSMDGASLGDKYETWVAQYYSVNEYKGSSYTSWQYSSCARIGGLLNSSGKKCDVDVNFWYLDKNRSGSGSNDIAKCSFSGAKAIKYTGGVLAPTYTVKSGNNTLKKGTDYTIGYANNIKLGTGYAYIRGIGEYSGYKLIPFEITDQDVPEEEEVLGENAYVQLTDEAKDAGYKLTDEQLSGIVAGNKVSAVKALVQLKEKYADCSIKVLDKDSGVSMSASKLVTTGDKLAISDVDGNRTAVATLKVKGTKPKISSVKGGKRKITVVWGKLASSKATGYQIKFCLDKSMPEELAGTKTIKSYKTTTTTLSTNYSDTYYVKVRSYKTIRSKKNYSSWSSVKSVKVK